MGALEKLALMTTTLLIAAPTAIVPAMPSLEAAQRSAPTAPARMNLSREQQRRVRQQQRKRDKLRSP